MNNITSTNLIETGSSKIWENNIQAPGMNLAFFKQDYRVRYVELVAEKINQSILSDIKIDAYGYNGTTPGPLIIASQGEWVFLTLINKLDEPTALTLEGFIMPKLLQTKTDLNLESAFILPGESYTYKLFCIKSGTFLYHSLQEFQVSAGLIGAIIVLPDSSKEVNLQIPDQDFILFMQAWELKNLSPGILIPGVYKLDNLNQNPNFFTINGKCFPETAPLFLRCNSRVRIRFITTASDTQVIHVNGHYFKLISVNGFKRDDVFNDTVEIHPGLRIEVELIADNPGIWQINETNLIRKTNNGIFPGGIITEIIYI